MTRESRENFRKTCIDSETLLQNRDASIYGEFKIVIKILSNRNAEYSIYFHIYV